jgi:hypothetical protein
VAQAGPSSGLQEQSWTGAGASDWAHPRPTAAARSSVGAQTRTGAEEASSKSVR